MRRFDSTTLLLILLCLLATLQVEAFGRTYQQAGALRQELVWRGEYWRFLTTIFLHDGWLHLALNALALYFIAPFLAQVCGRLVLLSTVVFGGLAGLAASLIVQPASWWRVGISGGVLAMLGLILAVEWALSRGPREFIRRRNVIVVLIFLALNVGLALYVEARWPRILIDHAAHAGGLVFGLAGGLALYGRGRIRVGRAVAVCLLLLVPGLGYAAHPFFNAEFYRDRAGQAYARGDPEGEASALESLLRLEPGNPVISARLALLLDDPAVLSELREPESNREEELVLAAYLELARRRLETDVETARVLVERARELKTAAAQRWEELARAAEAAGRIDIAVLAHEQAASVGRESASWNAARSILQMQRNRLEEVGLAPRQRLARSATALAFALRAAGGLREEATPDDDAHGRLERELDELAHCIAASTRIVAAAEPEARDLRRLYGDLARLWQRLADNARVDARAGRFLFWSAHWWWRELSGSERGFVLNRFRAAERAGDFETERLVRTWLREHRQTLPEPDLAEAEDGG